MWVARCKLERGSGGGGTVFVGVCARGGMRTHESSGAHTTRLDYYKYRVHAFEGARGGAPIGTHTDACALRHSRDGASRMMMVVGTGSSGSIIVLWGEGVLLDAQLKLDRGSS